MTTILEEYKKMNEADDKSIQSIVDIIKSGKEMMGMGKELESVFGKKNVDFSFSPVAHYRITVGRDLLIMVNKKYADKAEAIEGEYAIGYNGKV